MNKIAQTHCMIHRCILLSVYLYVRTNTRAIRKCCDRTNSDIKHLAFVLYITYIKMMIYDFSENVLSLVLLLKPVLY